MAEYVVKTTEKVERSYKFEPNDLGLDIPEPKLDSLIRSAARAGKLKIPNEGFIESEAKETISEVWRDEVRIYPRAKRK